MRFSKLWMVPLVAGAVGCSEAGPGSATVDVRMRQTDQILSQVTAGWFGGLSGTAAPIDPEVVSSLTVRVTGIAFLPADADENDEGGWVSLALDTPVELDLMALPTEGESPIVVASGAIAVGDYRNVRLMVDQAVIRFSAAVSLGAAFTLDADVDYEVTVPSADQTGIKTDAEFSVATDTQVDLLFSTGSTFQNVTATGNGQVILAPVIRGTGAGE
jgi:hypothetical protein